jgi:hypothetical protein
LIAPTIVTNSPTSQVETIKVPDQEDKIKNLDFKGYVDIQTKNKIIATLNEMVKSAQTNLHSLTQHNGQPEISISDGKQITWRLPPRVIHVEHSQQNTGGIQDQIVSQKAASGNLYGVSDPLTWLEEAEDYDLEKCGIKGYFRPVFTEIAPSANQPKLA